MDLSNEDISKYMVIDACMLRKRNKPDAGRPAGMCLLLGPGRDETLLTGSAIKWDLGYLLPYNEGFTKKAADKPARLFSEARLRGHLHPTEDCDRTAIHHFLAAQE